MTCEPPTGRSPCVRSAPTTTPTTPVTALLAAVPVRPRLDGTLGIEEPNLVAMLAMAGVKAAQPRFSRPGGRGHNAVCPALAVTPGRGTAIQSCSLARR